VEKLPRKVNQLRNLCQTQADPKPFLLPGGFAETSSETSECFPLEYRPEQAPAEVFGGLQVRGVDSAHSTLLAIEAQKIVLDLETAEGKAKIDRRLAGRGFQYLNAVSPVRLLDQKVKS
jgi:hypothetical protein